MKMFAIRVLKSQPTNLVGTYPELLELMTLAEHGKVRLSTSEYPLRDANRALKDLQHGRVVGRAVLVP
jgi:NAD+-dependent secondary alcohol dehydrogenase Adh1